jgi:hypothetical protein
MLDWLSKGYTTCRKSLERVQGLLGYREGDEIESVVLRVEAVITAYKANFDYPDEKLLVLPSLESRKRARSPTDSGVDVDSLYSKRRRLSLSTAISLESDEEDDLEDDLPLSLRRRRASRVIEVDSEDEDDGVNAFMPRDTLEEDGDIDEDSDDAFESEDEPASPDTLASPSSLNRRNRPANINTALAEQSAGYHTESADSPSPSPSTRTRTPKSKMPKTPKAAAPNPFVKHPWEDGWIPLTYNGPRGRPENMPHVPCPEGQDPRQWYGLSYKTQLARVEPAPAPDKRWRRLMRRVMVKGPWEDEDGEDDD